MPARRPPDASQTQCFEIRSQAQNFKTLSLMPARRRPDAMFQNQASDATFQDLPPDEIFCDHASDVQYESSYVYQTHIKLKELFEEPREPFGHLSPFLTSWIQFGSPERAVWVS